MGKHSASAFGRARERQVRLVPHDTVETGRPHDPWNTELIAKQRHGEVARRNARQHPRDECVAPERGAILEQRDFVFRTAIEIVEYHAREATARQLAQVGNVDGVGDAHAYPRLWLRTFWRSIKPNRIIGIDS